MTSQLDLYMQSAFNVCFLSAMNNEFFSYIKVHHKLIDSAKAAKETKSSASLSVIYKIQKLRS